ncbi:MAG: 3-isopropylmalate dehydratase small subunit [Chitinivibrionales bacterium]
MEQNTKKITGVAGKAVPVPGNDIDTDAIIPARFMRCTSFEGLGDFAFYDERFDENMQPRKHPLNDEKFKGHDILLVNKNFGCGSSREHAPQSLAGFGIRALIGESFADIFAGNCASMGMPAVTVDEQTAKTLIKQVELFPDSTVEIDLENQTVTFREQQYDISMPDSFRKAFLEGTWDTTEVLNQRRDQIEQTASRLPYMTDFAA